MISKSLGLQRKLKTSRGCGFLKGFMMQRAPIILPAVLVILLAGSCGLDLTDSSDDNDDDGSGGGSYYFLWIGADKDTYTSCGISQDCPYGEWNYGDKEWISVAYNYEYKRAFVHFPLPYLPPGAEILEASMELYHGAKQEDGTDDDQELWVHLAMEPWNPLELTWNNTPNTMFDAEYEFKIKMRSNGWCSSMSDIGWLVQTLMDNRNQENGFMIQNSGINEPAYDKSFSSVNDDSRTADFLGASPRLLMKIKLPSGYSIHDVAMPPVSADSDLNFSWGKDFLMMEYANGNDWPVDWHVARPE